MNLIRRLMHLSQHFQGLRRAQNKIETNGSTPEAAKKADPTMNPITRRPGPGRGRPKKQSQEPPAGQLVMAGGIPMQMQPAGVHGTMPADMQGSVQSLQQPQVLPSHVREAQHDDQSLRTS
jgi:hypothetical protein